MPMNRRTVLQIAGGAALASPARSALAQPASKTPPHGEALNKVELDLHQTNKDTPGYVVSGLRERERQFTNSVILHATYSGTR
jgi:hypothetical protein